ncbi:MAG: AAA family ATPase [Oscillospiraceae bacterium]|nr:AAA family ATPase [Oscillospiraceae bacterium]
MTREEVAAVEQNVVCLKHIQPQEVDWLWYPYIPRGKITIMQGDPGEGKTTLALQLAALVTRGFMFGGTGKTLAGTVMIQTAEDGMGDTIVPRLLRSGADMSRINNIREGLMPLSLTDDRLAQALEVYSPDLLIIDPLQAYLGSNVDMHRANEVRPVLSHVAELAERYGTAVLLIGHMNKMTGLKAMYKGLGSIDITAAARSVLLVAKNPKDPGMLFMGQVKSSLAPVGPVVGFERTERGPLNYLGEQSIDLQRLIDGESRVLPRDRAAEFLQDFLADGRKPVREVEEAAKAQGISKATLQRAIGQLSIKRIREKNSHYLALPEEESSLPEEFEGLTPADFEPLPC